MKHEGEDTILIVNDSPDQLELMSALLDKAGYRVLTAGNGRDGFRVARREHPDVVVSDVAMPNVNGIELCRLIRADRELRATPILLVSAVRTDSESAVEGLEAGADDYLEVPYESVIFVAKVARLVERARAEAALRESDENYRLLIEGVKDYAIFMLDTSGRVASWNQGVERVLGYSESEIMGRHFSCIFTPEDIESGEPERELRTATEEGRADDERWHVRKDGKRFWATGIVTPLRDESGRLRSFSKVMRDQTERKAAEEALRESEDRYRDLVEHSHDLMCTHDLEGRILSVNPWASKILGYDQSSLLKKNVRDVLAPEVRDEFDAYLARIQKNGFDEGLMLVQNTTGERRIWEYHNTLRTEGTAAPVVRGIAHDITERKRLEDQLQQQAEELAEANRIKDEFLATLSHELRAPLTSILGWAHLLRAGNLDETQSARALETIERNAKQQAQLIDDLLDVSRIITGKLRLEARPVELASIIEAATDAVRPAANARNIRLDSRLDPTAGPVSGDPSRLQQVIWNLLSNAIKFTSEGGRVEVQLERMNSHARIKVSDTGHGISPEFLPFVFDRFRQAENTGARAHGGLGLGLAIVRHLVELHGGTVRAESGGEGQGATFIVEIPLMFSHIDLNDSERRRPTVGVVSRLMLGGLRVLIVDDEADDRELISMVLAQHGAEVSAVASASEALREIERLKPNVLVSDIGLTGENGYDLISQVRALPLERGGRTPAAALTAYARTDDRMRALRAGFQMHLPKPVEPAELVTVVASLAGRSEKV